jgi:hypothetical protein
MSMNATSTRVDHYEKGFTKVTEKDSVRKERDLIASVLLDAVEQSFKPHEYKARRWLAGVYAHSLMILLDISPSAAMEHLQRKWRRIDADAPAPGQVIH